MKENILKKEDVGKFLPISDITPFTMEDFPNHIACVLWFKVCNFRCDYCHNPEFVIGNCRSKSKEEIFSFLNSRVGLLEGVVLSGGECTLFPELKNFVIEIKKLGFKVALHTNGSNPSLLKDLCNHNLIDYIALDYKAPKYLFEKVTKYKKSELFFESLDYLCTNNINFEIRTTIHTDLLNENDITSIILDLDNRKFKGHYYIQNFNKHADTLGNLSPQKRLLDISLIAKPKFFRLETRNF